MNIPSAWAPYMHGKCFDFALALHRLLPGSRLVAFGDPRFPDHVAVQVGANNQLVDVRGPLPIEQMLEGMNGQAQALAAGPIPVSVDDVALHMGFTAHNVRLSREVRQLARDRGTDSRHLLISWTCMPTSPRRKSGRGSEPERAWPYAARSHNRPPGAQMSQMETTVTQSIQGGLAVPPIGAHQQWCCAKGCGQCKVKTIRFEWRSVTDLATGQKIQSDRVLQDVSACCGEDLMLWDDQAQDFVDFEMVPREPAAVGS